MPVLFRRLRQSCSSSCSVISHSSTVFSLLVAFPLRPHVRLGTERESPPARRCTKARADAGLFPAAARRSSGGSLRSGLQWLLQDSWRNPCINSSFIIAHFSPKQYTAPSSHPMTILPSATAGELPTG